MAPGIHVDATRHKLPTQTLVQTKYTPLVAMALPDGRGPQCGLWHSKNCQGNSPRYVTTSYKRGCARGKSDPRWGLQRSDLALTCWSINTGPLSVGGSDLVQYILWMLNSIGVWGIWRPGGCLKLFPRPIPEQFSRCSIAHCPAPVATAIKECCCHEGL